MTNNKSSEVYKELQKKGIPDEVCSELCNKYINTEYTSERMLGYLRGMSQPSFEQIVDEMFAIISERDRLVDKHRSEQAQASINKIYNEGL